MRLDGAGKMSVTKHKPRSGDFDAALGERLRKHRRDRGLSQSKLAKRVGLTYQQIQKYENGESRVSAATLVKLAAAMELRLESLIGDGSNLQIPADPGASLVLKDRLLAAFEGIRSPQLQVCIVTIVEHIRAGERGLA